KQRWRRSFASAALAFFLGSIGAALLAVFVGWAPPESWTEPIVALCLIPPALAVAKGDESSLVTRFPFVMGILAGLVHGFSMARVFLLSTQGAMQRADALFSFVAGILVILVAVALIAAVILTVLQKSVIRQGAEEKSRAPLALALSYGIGIAGATWFFERLS
ncbi:MAG: HupE/UreJ family protein, partial [Verrucomicrobiota bacterium]